MISIILRKSNWTLSQVQSSRPWVPGCVSLSHLASWCSTCHLAFCTAVPWPACDFANKSIHFPTGILLVVPSSEKASFSSILQTHTIITSLGDLLCPGAHSPASIIPSHSITTSPSGPYSSVHSSQASFFLHRWKHFMTTSPSTICFMSTRDISGFSLHFIIQSWTWCLKP